MTTLWDQIQAFFFNIINRPTLIDILDILLVALLLYQLLKLTRETRASQVLKGFLILIVVSWLSELIGLKALSWLLVSVVNNGAVVLIILFQPELRRVLEQVGRGTRLDSHRYEDSDENARIVEEITQCVMRLAARRVGALIVFEQKTGLNDIVETGTRLDAAISAPLLENIFEPNTPLHDGAVIIRGGRVLAAACVLTLSESTGISRDLGTRHRAAIGVSETTDVNVIIVSEETGIVSLARGGKLTRHLDAAALRALLGGMYHAKRVSVLSTLRTRAKEVLRRDR